MHKANRLLLASVAIALVGGPQAFAQPQARGAIVVAQAAAEVPEAVAAAQANVDAARTALEQATATGTGIKEARLALRAAIKALNGARVAAGLPPVGEPQQDTAEQPQPQGPSPAAEAQPPAKQQPAPATAEAPSAPEPGPAPVPKTKKPKPPTNEAAAPPPNAVPDAAAVQPPADQQPAPATAEAPPAPEPAPVAKTKKPKPPTSEAASPPPNAAPDAAVQPPADQQPAPATAEAPPAPEPAPAPVAKTKKPKPPTSEAAAPPPNAAPDAAQPPAGRPPAPTTAAHPAPVAKAKRPQSPTTEASAPPALANGQPPAFDPSLLKKPHPRFGETPKGTDKVPLPAQEAQIPKGGEIDAGAGRTIVKQDDGQITIRHNDTERFRELGGDVTVQQGPGGTTTTVINRPGGVQIVTVRDRDGNILQRYRKDASGQIQVLIGQVEPQRNGNRPPPPPKPPAPNASFDFHIQLPPLNLTIPDDQYIVESSRASPRQLTQTFAAPPVERVERPYSLEEIRRSERIRDKVRRVDFDTVTFEFGSAVLPDDQIPQMQKVGEAMQAVLQRDPGQVFLIEGHTDAVGSDLANLALSDRRAETVAQILTYYFGVPPENLVTQGYGEQFLKIPTTGPERENRRVAFRNITALMRTSTR